MSDNSKLSKSMNLKCVMGEPHYLPSLNSHQTKEETFINELKYYKELLKVFGINNFEDISKL